MDNKVFVSRARVSIVNAILYTEFKYIAIRIFGGRSF